MESPTTGRRIGRLLLAGVTVLLLVEFTAFVWQPRSWSVGDLLVVALFVPLGLATLAEVPVRVGFDGASLRVRYALGQRTIPLADIVAADLAPGSRPGISALRLAPRGGRILVLNLDAPAAESVASRLERAGLLVNRAPPPTPPRAMA